jgi:hypothetical protein
VQSFNLLWFEPAQLTLQKPLSRFRHIKKGKRMNQNESKFIEPERSYISLKYQIALIGISSIAFFIMLYFKASVFSTQETPPTILPISPKSVQQFGDSANPVETGISITEFIDFDIVTNQFTFDGIIWFSFEPEAVALDSLDQFSFVKGNIIKKSAPTIKLINDKLNVQYTIRVTFKSDLSYKDFPLDNHQIYIVLINQALTPSEISFESSLQKFLVSADVSTEGWDLVNRAIQTGYFQSQLDPHDPLQTIAYPGIVFILDYKRNSIRYALSILLPLAMIFYLTLFSISIRLLSAIAIAVTAVTAILAYRFVIENLSPKTGFFMLSDYLFFLFLAATVAIFIIDIAESGFSIPPWGKKITILIIHLIVLGASIYFLLW